MRKDFVCANNINISGRHVKRPCRQNFIRAYGFICRYNTKREKIIYCPRSVRKAVYSLPPWHLPCSAQLRQLQPHEDFPAALSFLIRKIISTITAARIINVITVPILFISHVMRKSPFFSRFFKLEFIILYFRIICKGSLRRPCKNLLIFQSV